MPSTSPRDFFGTKRDTAEIKSEFLVPFFQAWCSNQINGINSGEKSPLLYFDLNAGSEDIQALLEAINKSNGKAHDLTQHISTWFYTSNSSLSESMKAVLDDLTIKEVFAHQPVVLDEQENQELLTELLAQNKPGLVYLEPFSVNHTSDVPVQILNNTEAELFMLFTPDELRNAFSKKKLSPVVEQLFAEQLPVIRSYFKTERNAAKRTDFILDNLETTLRIRGYIPFRFSIGLPDKNEIGHYLILAAKSAASFTSIKELLLPYTDYRADGVPLFSVNQKQLNQLSLFPDEQEQSVDNLATELAQKAKQFNYKLIEKIFEQHHTGTPYIKDNYKMALEKLRDQGNLILLNSKTMQPIKKATFTSMVKYKAP